MSSLYLALFYDQSKREQGELGADIFMLEGISYLLMVDYFSRYPEVIRLTSTTSSSIITGFKSAMALQDR